MSLGTLDRSPPPLFKQGHSARSKLLIYSALAVFLMVADKRFEFSEQVRSALVTVMTPVRIVALAPVRAMFGANQYFESLSEARQQLATSQALLLKSAIRSNRVEQLSIENAQLRKLLGLSPKLGISAKTAEVLYDAPDPYSRKVIIDQGSLDHIVIGSPVVAADGVIGQVTRVHPSVSEVTLLTHRDHTTPVLNVRTGVRSVAYGHPASQGDTIELRFMSANADIAVGDILSTSGIDGVYPAGLAVAQVTQIERRADSAFARIYCAPLANPMGAQQVLVVTPLSDQIPPRPAEEAVPAPVPLPAKKGGRK
jgi:rod shape-determining protein MreC